MVPRFQNWKFYSKTAVFETNFSQKGLVGICSYSLHMWSRPSPSIPRAQNGWPFSVKGYLGKKYGVQGQIICFPNPPSNGHKGFVSDIDNAFGRSAGGILWRMDFFTLDLSFLRLTLKPVWSNDKSGVKKYSSHKIPPAEWP